MSIFGGLVKKPIAHDTVNFSAGLRNSQSSMNERERRWNCIPSRDRSLFPRFLRKVWMGVKVEHDQEAEEDE